MQPNGASRRPIIEIDISEVTQGSDNPDLLTAIKCQDQSATTKVTRPTAGQGSLDSRSLNPHTSPQGSLNPPIAGTGSLGPGSLDQRAARQRTRATEHGSLDSGSLDLHASQQGSLNPPVAGAGSLDPGSLDQRAARPEARSVEQGFTRLRVTQPTCVSARITRSTSCCNRITRRVNSSAGIGSSGRR